MKCLSYIIICLMILMIVLQIKRLISQFEFDVDCLTIIALATMVIIANCNIILAGR